MIKEIRRKKEQLRNGIAMLVKHFENDTGVRILHSKRYAIYIDKVLEDIYLKLFEKLIKLRIRKAIELEFPRPIFNI